MLTKKLGKRTPRKKPELTWNEMATVVVLEVLNNNSKGNAVEELVQYHYGDEVTDGVKAKIIERVRRVAEKAMVSLLRFMEKRGHDITGYKVPTGPRRQRRPR